MIVCIRHPSGIYASPVFAEIGKSWKTESVVLNKAGNRLLLLPLLKNKLKLSYFNYLYIDESLRDGWIEKKAFVVLRKLSTIKQF